MNDLDIHREVEKLDNWNLGGGGDRARLEEYSNNIILPKS